MIEQQVPIINKLGLHARAAAKFVTLASSFTAEVMVKRNGREVNGKSIMGVMTLAAARGTDIIITTEGDDEQQAMAALVGLINNRFEEDE